MNILKLLMIFFAFFVMGCEKTKPLKHISGFESNTDNNSKPLLHKFDFYICKSIGGDKEYKSDIYGHNPNWLVYEGIALDLGQKYGLIDDCVNDIEGNIFFTSRKNNAIYKIDKYGKTISQIATGFDIAWGLAYDKKRDRLYLSNWHGNENPQYGKIEYIDLKSMHREAVEFDGNKTHILKSAGKLAFDNNNNNLYISDTFGKKIYKYNIESNSIDEFVTLTAQPETIALTNDKLFIMQYDDNFLINVDLESKQKRVLIKNNKETFPEETLAIDNKRGKILFGKAEKTKGQLGSSEVVQVHSANLDGSNIEVIKNPLADVNSKYYSEKYGLYGLQAIRVVQ